MHFLSPQPRSRDSVWDLWRRDRLCVNYLAHVVRVVGRRDLLRDCWQAPQGLWELLLKRVVQPVIDAVEQVVEPLDDELPRRPIDHQGKLVLLVVALGGLATTDLHDDAIGHRCAPDLVPLLRTANQRIRQVRNMGLAPGAPPGGPTSGNTPGRGMGACLVVQF